MPSSLGTGLPVLFLRVPGRRSGEVRPVPLLYARDGETLVVVESNWGSLRRPAWALNLDASGKAEVTVGGLTRTVTARRASAAEATRWWPRLIEIWPGWTGYRRRAAREIGLYVLEPAPPS